jgi:hypothetical protein
VAAKPAVIEKMFMITLVTVFTQNPRLAGNAIVMVRAKTMRLALAVVRRR